MSLCVKALSTSLWAALDFRPCARLYEHRENPAPTDILMLTKKGLHSHIALSISSPVHLTDLVGGKDHLTDLVSVARSILQT